MLEVSTIGLDLAKNVFQVHGANASGEVVFRWTEDGCAGREFARRAREDEEAKRLTTIPGIGPITATALVALAPAA